MDNPLVAQVRQHAEDHYTDGGWDVIVECFTDEELAELIGEAATFEEALATVSVPVSVWADRQADARNSAF